MPLHSSPSLTGLVVNIEFTQACKVNVFQEMAVETESNPYATSSDYSTCDDSFNAFDDNW